MLAGVGLKKGIREALALEERHEEQALRKEEKTDIGQIGKISERLLSGIVQSIEAAVVLHDRDLKIVFVNDSFESIFELQAKDAIGRSPMDFLPEFDKRHKKAIHHRLQNNLRTGTRSPYHEFPYCSPSGTYRHLVAISIPIFDDTKEITHVMSVIHDVTALKELEQESVRAAKLSSVADMAYTLAHEINNPLTGMKLALSSLHEGLKKEENIQVLDSVMRDLSRIQNTIHDFLKAKKKPSLMERHEITIVEDIIDDVLFNISGQLNLQNIEVEKRFCGGGSYVSLDRDEIYRMLLNVLLNAIEAVDKKGKITISTIVTSPKETSLTNGPFLRISMADTGIGIDQKGSEEVFKSFYSSKPVGTGLGLSICRNIVSRHSGFMEFETESGKGTTVRIYLPLVKE